MKEMLTSAIEKLLSHNPLSKEEYVAFLENNSKELRTELARYAIKAKQEVYGNDIYIRGLIEFTNYCKNNCYYCGLRRDNHCVERYRLQDDEILACCENGYELGFRTFVLQGGEDGQFADEKMVPLVARIRNHFPDCAITLSLGERSKESYQRLFDAGANRYLLRHETAVKSHYEKLHPSDMSWDHRMECLSWLKEIGYQVGCGFMVGSPYQTNDMLAEDLMLIQQFQPDMVGIGPFLRHGDTPFAEFSDGSLETTLLCISLLRLMQPNLLLPATTALATIAPDGREQGILAGANVVMPNLSPVKNRKQYSLYDNKIFTNEEAAEGLLKLRQRMQAIGCEIVIHRGDSKIKKEGQICTIQNH